MTALNKEAKFEVKIIMSRIETDNIADKDLLGRKKFAQQIVKSLSTSFEKIDESIVVGICGRWGSGKSTLLNYIDLSLRDSYNYDSEKFRIIHFNPWAGIGIEDLQRNFLEVVIKELENITWKNKLEESNNSFKKYLKYLNYLKFVKHVHPVAEKIIDAVEDYTNEISVLSIEEIKKQANELIKEKEIKLYIFLDDIDRLAPEEITSVFKIIKLNLSFLNTCFIIAYDKKVVIDALNSQFVNNGESYLEKIIQVDFIVPEILDEQIEDIFFSKLKKILYHLNIEFEEHSMFSIWKYHGLKEYFKTIRDIKRYFNTLIFSLPNIDKEINIYDFIILEAIKVFDYKSYERLYSEILSIQRKAVWESISFDKTTIEQYINSTTQSLLSYLFIKEDYARIRGQSFNAKRLNDSEIFPRYYSLYIPSRDITEDTLSKFLANGSNRKQILSEVLKNNKMKNLLRRLSDSDLSKYYQIDDYQIFIDFINFWDENFSEFISDWDELIWSSYFNLAHSFKNKFEAANNAVKNLILPTGKAYPMKFIFNYYIVLFKNDNRTDPQFYNEVGNSLDFFIETIKDGFNKNLMEFYSYYLWEAVQGREKFVTNLVLRSFARYFPEEYKEKIIDYFKHPFFNSFFIKSNFIMTGGDNKPGRLNLSERQLLLPEDLFEIFIRYLKEMKNGGLSSGDQEVVDFFLKQIVSEE